jgi:hypothetical protein
MRAPASFMGDFDAAGSGNQGIAVNPQTDLVYVTSPDANVVTAANGQSGQRVAAIPWRVPRLRSP